MTGKLARPLELGPMPLGRTMETVDEQFVRASVNPLQRTSQHLIVGYRRLNREPAALVALRVLA